MTPGCRAARDVPGRRFYGLIVPDWPGFVAEGEETRYVGDVLAAVAAIDARTARAAAALVEVEYEILAPVTDPEEALREGAPRVGPEGNLLSRSVVRRGDAEAALAVSAHVVEGTWRTQRIEHLYLEPEACLAAPHDRARQEVALGPDARGALTQRLLGVGHGREDFVFHLYERSRGAGGPRVDRGDRGENVADIARLLALGHETGPVRDDEAVETPPGHVARRHDRHDARVPRRAGRARAAFLRPHRPGLARFRGRGRGDALCRRRSRRGRRDRRADRPRRGCARS